MEYDLETLRRKVFPDSVINIKNLLTKLELNNIITIGHNHIKLTPWPQVGCRNSEGKGERFERESWHEPDPVQPSNAGKDAAKLKRQGKLISKSGLTGFRFPPAFDAFLLAWPNQPITYDQKKYAWREWDALVRSKMLPDISLIMLTLKAVPPGPHNWPGTWLKKKPWQKPAAKIACATCNDEKIVYGVRPDGTKGAIPCPKCA